jgi:hypothetical protein
MSKLNPNAKSFIFNPNAKPYVFNPPTDYSTARLAAVTPAEDNDIGTQDNDSRSCLTTAAINLPDFIPQSYDAEYHPKVEYNTEEEVAETEEELYPPADDENIIESNEVAPIMHTGYARVYNQYTNRYVNVVVTQPMYLAEHSSSSIEFATPSKREAKGEHCYERAELMQIYESMRADQFQPAKRLIPGKLLNVIANFVLNSAFNEAEPQSKLKKKKKGKGSAALSTPANKSLSKREESQRVMEALKAGAIASAHKTPAKQREKGQNSSNLDDLADYSLHKTVTPWKSTVSAVNSPNLLSPSENDNKLAELGKDITAILNKLAPEKFDRLILQTVALGIMQLSELELLVKLIFDKACDEPNFAVLYAAFCAELSPHMPVFQADTSAKQQNFRSLLLTRCYNVLTADLPALSSGICSENHREVSTELQQSEIEGLARLKQKGNIVLIGELFKQEMLARSIIHLCADMLLENNAKLDEPQESDLQSLAILLTNTGKLLEAPENGQEIPGKPHKSAIMDQHFAKIQLLAQSKALPSRLRFMLLDLIELRARNWVQRREMTVNPKLLKQIHEEFGLTPQKSTKTNNSAYSAFKKPNNPNNSAGIRTKLPSTTGKVCQDVRFKEENDSLPPLQRAYSEPKRESTHSRSQNSPKKPPKSILKPAKQVSSHQNDPPHEDSCQLEQNSAGNSTIKLPTAAPRLTKLATVAGPIVSASKWAKQLNSALANSLEAAEIEQNLTNHRGNNELAAASVANSARLLSPAQQNSKKTVVKLVGTELSKKITLLVEEFWSSNDLNEAVLCLEEISGQNSPPTSSESPFAAPTALTYDRLDARQQLIYRAVINSWENQQRQREQCSKLIAGLVVKREISIYQVLCGLSEIISNLDELYVDFPNLIQYLSQLLATACSDHLLSLKQIGALLQPMTILQNNGQNAAKLMVKVLAEVQRQKEERFLIKLWLELLQNNGLSLLIQLFRCDALKVAADEEVVQSLIEKLQENGLEILVKHLNNTLNNSITASPSMQAFASYSPIIRPSSYSPVIAGITQNHNYLSTSSDNLNDFAPLPASPAKINIPATKIPAPCLSRSLFSP